MVWVSSDRADRTGSTSVGSALIGPVFAGTAATSLSPGETAEIRPIATAATRMTTAPRPVKKPTCSMIRMSVVEATGVPPRVTPPVLHSGLSTVPRANQAPAAAARVAPNSAMCLPVAIISRTPPRNTAAPGRISSHSRAVV